MKELNFDFEVKQIKVNGHVFDAHKSDIDIISVCNEILKDYEANAKLYTPNTAEGREKITSMIFKIRDFIDEMLGEGALRTIADGKPVSLIMALKVMQEVAATISEEYQEDIQADHPFGAEKKAQSGRAKAKK